MLYKTGVERHVKYVVHPFHENPFDMKVFQNKMKTVASCSELVRESSSSMLEKQEFMKEEVKVG